MKLLLSFCLATFLSCGIAQNSEYNKLIEDGLELLKQQNTSLAIHKYNLALKIDSFRVEANYGLGVAYLQDCQEQKKHCDNSLYYLNKAIKIDSSYRNGYFNRGQCKGSLGDYKGALDDFNRAIHKNPKQPDNYFSRAMIKIKLQDNIGACEDFHKSALLGDEQGSKMFQLNCGIK